MAAKDNLFQLYIHVNARAYFSFINICIYFEQFKNTNKNKKKPSESKEKRTAICSSQSTHGNPQAEKDFRKRQTKCVSSHKLQPSYHFTNLKKIKLSLQQTARFKSF